MDKTQVKHMLYKLMEDEYYKKLRALESDVDFFKLLMERERKSEFRFDLRISYMGSFKAFDDIWKKYGYLRDELETAFAEFMLLKFIILDIYDETNKFTKSQIKDFIKYFEQYEDTLVEAYIGDFVGCSRGCGSVKERIEKIMS